MHEFDIIKNYFAVQELRRPDVVIGIGDDASILDIPPDKQLVVTTDTLVENTHFFPNVSAFDLGYKALAVNLSDLAAMGATPCWFTLAITIPANNEAWLQEFSNGLFTLANIHQIQLIGGDITKGPLSITIQAMGLVPKNRAILRSGAKVGDLIYVTGTLGSPGLALQNLLGNEFVEESLRRSLYVKLHRPEPRVISGQLLQGLANAAIDISDGLAADLGHILEQSNVGATLYVDRLPFSDEMKNTLPLEKAIALALTAGDDYELCFTVSPENKVELEKKLGTTPCRFTCIGKIKIESGLELKYEDGSNYHGSVFGYQHF